jgi:hypothetical protein
MGSTYSGRLIDARAFGNEKANGRVDTAIGRGSERRPPGGGRVGTRVIDVGSGPFDQSPDLFLVAEHFDIAQTQQSLTRRAHAHRFVHCTRSAAIAAARPAAARAQTATTVAAAAAIGSTASTAASATTSQASSASLSWRCGRRVRRMNVRIARRTVVCRRTRRTTAPAPAQSTGGGTSSSSSSATGSGSTGRSIARIGRNDDDRLRMGMVMAVMTVTMTVMGVSGMGCRVMDDGHGRDCDAGGATLIAHFTTTPID